MSLVVTKVDLKLKVTIIGNSEYVICHGIIFVFDEMHCFKLENMHFRVFQIVETNRTRLYSQETQECRHANEH